jgi:hypothetical protein
VEEMSKLDGEGNILETRNLLYVNDNEIREKKVVASNVTHIITKTVLIIYISQKN